MPRSLGLSTFVTRVSCGAIAQLGERYNGIVEVTGSIPVGSTKQPAAVSRPFATWATAAAPPAGKALPRGGFRRFAILARMGGETPYAARLFPFPCGAAFFCARAAAGPGRRFRQVHFSKPAVEAAALRSPAISAGFDPGDLLDSADELSLCEGTARRSLSASLSRQASITGGRRSSTTT